jgi:hypothetical protein
MSLRQLTRIVLHLALALSVALPTLISLQTPMDNAHHAMSVERSGNAPKSQPQAVASISNGGDAGCHGEHAALLRESDPSPIAPTANEGGSADCCDDGDCAAHGCDRATCMQILAWLPRFVSIAQHLPAHTRFFAPNVSPQSRQPETLLRPPIA